MSENQGPKAPSAVIPVLSLIVSLAAVAIAVYSVMATKSAEERAYQRVVDDTWRSVQPVYKDFGIKEPASKPTSIAEILTPLMEVTRTGHGTP